MSVFEKIAEERDTAERRRRYLRSIIQPRWGEYEVDSLRNEMEAAADQAIDTTLGLLKEIGIEATPEGVRKMLGF